MCMIDDCERNEFSSSVKRKARKEHRCDECRRTIQPGETYELNVGMYDGMFNTNKVCAHCLIATAWLAKNCGGYVTDAVLEDIREHIEEYRGVYNHAVGPLKRIEIGMGRGWRVKRGPRAGQMMAIPKLPPVIGERVTA